MLGAIIPTLRYTDAPAAIEWLCAAFEFKEHLVVPGEDGSIMHAQLTNGPAMIMLGSNRDDEFGQLQKSPLDTGGVCTQSSYIVVADVDAHCERARNAGAKVVMEPIDQDYGGRSYSCLDPEGHVWNFGDYDPWGS